MWLFFVKLVCFISEDFSSTSSPQIRIYHFHRYYGPPLPPKHFQSYGPTKDRLQFFFQYEVVVSLVIYKRHQSMAWSQPIRLVNSYTPFGKQSFRFCWLRHISSHWNETWLQVSTSCQAWQLSGIATESYHALVFSTVTFKCQSNWGMSNNK